MQPERKHQVKEFKKENQMTEEHGIKLVMALFIITGKCQTFYLRPLCDMKHDPEL